MTIKEKLNLLEELLEIKEGSLREDTELNQIEQWDSMAIIAVIAMLDENSGIVVAPEKVKGFKTIKDITDEMK